MAKTYNGARMTTATTGTGTITLGAAVSGFLSFSGAGVADGDVVAYGISDASNFECGTGTYTASGTTLTRTVTTSTNSNSAINLSGSAQVFITVRKEDLLMTSESRTANTVLAAPDGSNSTPSFRSLVLADLPLTGPVLLNTLTLSGGTFDDTTSLTSTYFYYHILLFGIQSANVEVAFRVHSGGAFQTTSYINTTSTADRMVLTSTSVSTTTTNGGMSGHIWLTNPTQTSSPKILNSQFTYVSSSTGFPIRNNGGGYWNTTSAIDGFRIFPTSGSITAGVVKVYGVK